MVNESQVYLNVIVPVYNGEKYLEETISSIEKSTYKKIKIILINDGSLDDSLMVCKRMAEKYNNIIVIDKQNGGIVSARNIGVDNSNNDYICFCDQDDLVEEDMYQRLITICEDNKLDMAFCSTNRLVDGMKIPCESYSDGIYKGEEISRDIILPLLFNGTDFIKKKPERRAGSIWKCVFRTKLLNNNNIRFRKYINYEDDLLFLIDCLTHASSVGTLSYYGYNWRINLSSETYNWKYIREYEKKFNSYLSDVLNMTGNIVEKYNCSDEYVSSELCNFHLNFIINEASNKNQYLLADRISRIRKTLNKERYKEALAFSKHINKTSINKKIICNLCKLRLWLVAYFFARTYKIVREKNLGARWFVIEKKIKNI